MKLFTASFIVLVAAVIIDLGKALRLNSFLAQTFGMQAPANRDMPEAVQRVSADDQENVGKLDRFLTNTFTNHGEHEGLVADHGRALEEDAIFSFSNSKPDIVEAPVAARQPDIAEAPVAARQDMHDVIIVLDSSGSIGPDEFLKAKQFMAEFVSLIPGTISPDYTRIAFISFSEGDKIITEFNFLNHTDRGSVIQAINRIHYQDGAATYTAMALQRAQELFATSGRRRANKVLLLATDGRSNGDGNPAIPANEMKNTDRHDVLIQVVAVSDNVNVQEIEAIASSPPTDNVYYISTFTEATLITKAVREHLISRGAISRVMPRPAPVH